MKKRLLSLLLASVLAVASIVPVSGDEEDVIMEQMWRHEEMLYNTQDALNELAYRREVLLEQISEMNEYLVELMLAIDETQENIDLTESKITETKQKIAVTNQKLKAAVAERDRQYEAMKQRIQYIYENGGDVGLLIQVIEAEDLTAFFNKAEYAEQIETADREMLDNLKQVVLTIRDIKAELKQDKADLETQKGYLVAQKADMDQQKQVLDDEIYKREVASDEYAYQIEVAKEQAEELRWLIREENRRLNEIEAEKQAAARAAAEAAARAEAARAAAEEAAWARQQAQEAAAAAEEAEAGGYDGDSGYDSDYDGDSGYDSDYDGDSGYDSDGGYDGDSGYDSDYDGDSGYGGSDYDEESGYGGSDYDEESGYGSSDYGEEAGGNDGADYDDDWDGEYDLDNGDDEGDRPDSEEGYDDDYDGYLSEDDDSLADDDFGEEEDIDPSQYLDGDTGSGSGGRYDNESGGSDAYDNESGDGGGYGNESGDGGNYEEDSYEADYNYAGGSTLDELRAAAAEAEQRAQEAEEAANRAAGEALEYINDHADTLATTDVGASIVAAADQYVGNPYVYGGSSLTNGVDCSHFVWLILQQSGVYNGEYMTSGEFAYAGESVSSLDEARAGDVIVYPHHVAIYDGNGGIVEAKGSAYGITHDRTADHTTILSIRRFV